MFLGIDLGTSGVKAVIIGAGGGVVAQATAPLGIMRPEPGHSEQDPEEWWQATGRAVTELPADLRAEVLGIGLSGQMHGATLLGKDGNVLRPAILWNDGRSAAECHELERREPRTQEITGNLVMPGFTAPKLLWVEGNEPEIFRKIAKVLLPKDYLRYRMSGEFASDMSDASGTCWLDVAARKWSDAMVEATNLPMSAMPSVHEGVDVTGALTRDVAEAWGMNQVPIVAGGGDNAAGAVGAGVLAEGEAFLSLGTSGVLFVAGNKFRPNPARGIHAFCHAVPNRWHEMTVMLSAASCLDWGARLTGATDVPSFIAMAERARSGSVPLFLPYLSGERTPHNDPSARGVFFGMDQDTAPAEIAQSVLEGVAFGLADGFEALENAASVEAITVIGGGSRSHYWGTLIASIFGKDLVYREGSEVGPALGAARLAKLGVTHAPNAEVCAPGEVKDRVRPDTTIRQSLLPRFERYRELYRRTADLF